MNQEYDEQEHEHQQKDPKSQPADTPAGYRDTDIPGAGVGVVAGIVPTDDAAEEEEDDDDDDDD